MLEIEQEFRRGIELHKSGNLQEAEAIYRAVVSIAPSFFHANYLLAIILLNRSELNEARELIIRAISQNNETSSFYCCLGHIEMKLNQMAEAVKAYAACLQINPQEFEALLYLGRIKLEQGYLEEAESLLRSAYSVNSTSALVNAFLGEVFVKQGKYDWAGDAFNTAIANDIRCVEAHRCMGRLKLFQNQYSEADYFLRKALEFEPENPQSHVDLAELFFRQGNIAWAKGAYDTAVNLGEDPAHLCELGLILEIENFMDEAKKQYIKALSKDASNLRAQSLLARMSLKKGNGKTAIDQYSAMIKRESTSAEYYNGLILAYFMSGNNADAMKCFRDLVRLEVESLFAMYKDNY
jgi:protein O-GlcNAc transferase